MNKETTKLIPGDELHLTMLMAPYSLNLVTGQDRQHLLAFGRAAFDAGKNTGHASEPVASMLTFVNGKPAKCGCRFSYSDGGGEYSDVGSVTLCAKHAGTERNGIERAEPFMWAIQEPGGGAYMDEGCVSSVREDVQAEVDGLNSGLDADDDPYQVVPVYLAAAPQAVQAAVPEGWVPCVITYEGQHPEEIAYGPQTMMDRLKKWLDRYFEMRTAPAHPAEGVANEDDAFEKWWSTPHVWGLGHKAAQRSAFAAGLAHAAATQPAAQGMEAQQYRLIERGELIEAGDQFLRDDFTWQIDPRGIFVGVQYGAALRPARRALAAQAKQGGAA